MCGVVLLYGVCGVLSSEEELYSFVVAEYGFVTGFCVSDSRFLCWCKMVLGYLEVSLFL